MEKDKLGNILNDLTNLNVDKTVTESKIYLNKIDKYKEKIMLYTTEGKKVYKTKIEACVDHNVSIHAVKAFMVKNKVSFESAIKYLAEGKK